MNSIFLISIIVSIFSLNNANVDELRKAFDQDSKSLNFTGKVVLVTGSGSGLGAETTRLFCYLGAQVVITDIDINKVKKVAKECQQLLLNNGKNKLLGVVADLTKEDHLNRLVSDTIRHYGRVDILVNMAGIEVMAGIEDSNYLESFDKVLSINLRAVASLIGQLVPYLKQSNGQVINIASMAAKVPIKKESAYSATKAAIVQLTRTLAVELGPNIRVNCISPGFVKGTGITSIVPQFVKDQISARTSLNKVGHSLDIAKAIAFLTSPLAQFVTGQNLEIDGGLFSDLNEFNNFIRP